MTRFFTFICIAIVCVFSASITQGQIVNIPDPNLEPAVRTGVGVPAPTPITTTDMLNLVALHGANDNITLLEGLQYAENLVYLDLYHNNISDLSPLTGLTNLYNVNLYRNQISDLSPLSGATNLYQIMLALNQISDISPLSGLSNLQNLWLEDNPISNITPLSGMTNLQVLGLYRCQISDISALSGLVNLKALDVNNNMISDISSMVGLINMVDLDVSSNQVTNISSLSGMTKIYKLILNNNQISDISVLSGMTKMEELNLNNNQINDISCLAGMTDMENLYLGGNQISDVSFLSGIMDNMFYLDLSDNQIETLDLRGAKLNYLINCNFSGNPMRTVLLKDMTTNGYGFDDFLGSIPDQIQFLDMSNVDFTNTGGLYTLYSKDDIETLLLSGASNLRGDRVVAFTQQMDSLNWLDVTGLWDTFDTASQNALLIWDAEPGNTLVVPEPATLGVLAVGGLTMLRRRRN
ncbi:MAG: leucine-rich repeat domain-containing protein [Phycisphaerae bacterium]|nr:leucine-rich repeat domain-containing protein [Phycisphaerae bacterium]